MIKLEELKNKASDHNLNFRSWKTNRKIVVIESDDWGTIRTPSKDVYESMKNQGFNMDLCPYNRYDTLASTEDLECLFETLLKYKDYKGNHPIITANSLVANPDFVKIKESNFNDYFFEDFTETLKRQYPKENVFSLWKDGLTQNVFKPQFHGREHINVNHWLRDLRDKIPEAMIPFNHNFFGLSRVITNDAKRTYMAAFDFNDKKELSAQKNIIKEGLDLFEELFGYRSKSFIAPNYIWHSELEPFLKECGVLYLQGARAQREPAYKKNIIKKHYTGESNINNQIYLSRNVAFEPTIVKQRNLMKKVIKQIAVSFLWNAPVIISTHRLNFIGTLNKNNRQENLKSLELLLKEILKRWPEVEFMTSDQLGDIISSQKFN